MATDNTTLVIKNPSRSNQQFSISFQLDGSIADLQKLLSETYDGRPAPADQTLIYGGKVLKDTSVRLRDIFSKHDEPEGPHNIHLVIKQKPATSLPSPARSVDSSASVSRATSTLNTSTSGAYRPTPPPTRTPPPIGGSSLVGAGPSSGGNQSSSQQAGDPSARVSTAASQGDPDESDLSAAFFSSFAAFAGGVAMDGSAAGHQGAAASAAAAAAATPLATMPFMFYNPLIGGAYQAAYSAALAALSIASQQPVLQQGQQSTETPCTEHLQDQEGRSGSSTGVQQTPVCGAPDKAAPTTTAANVAAGAQQFVYVPMFVPTYGQGAYPFGMPGLYPQQAGAVARRNAQAPGDPAWALYPGGMSTFPNLFAGGAGAGVEGLGMMGFEDLLDALQDGPTENIHRQGGRGQEGEHGQAYGGAAPRENQPGLRFRRARVVVPLAAAAGNQQNGAPAVRNRPMRAPWRARVLTIRISTRALLQALVFAIVLYQHFTWRRFLALLFGGAVLLITSTWAPFRRLILGMHAMPARPAGAAGRPGDGGGPAAVAGAGAEGAVAQAAAGGRPAIQRRGFFHEILVFIVGFITSLLPAWNFNPEDAAAFAAAQEVVAVAEERVGQQPAPAGGERGVAAAEGAGAAQPAQGGNEVPEVAGPAPAGNP